MKTWLTIGQDDRYKIIQSEEKPKNMGTVLFAIGDPVYNFHPDYVINDEVAATLVTDITLTETVDGPQAKIQLLNLNGTTTTAWAINVSAIPSPFDWVYRWWFGRKHSRQEE